MNLAFIKNSGEGGKPSLVQEACARNTHSAGLWGQWGGWCSSLGHTRTLDPCSPDSAPAEAKGTLRCPGNQKDPDNKGKKKKKVQYRIQVQQKWLNVSCVPCRRVQFPQKRCSCSCTCLNGCRERWGAGRSLTLKEKENKNSYQRGTKKDWLFLFYTWLKKNRTRHCSYVNNQPSIIN